MTLGECRSLASRPGPPLRSNSPSVTRRRRHERTCSALWPQASATAYRWEAATVPSSPTIPKTSVLVGISTVGSATIVILTTGAAGVNRFVELYLLLVSVKLQKWSGGEDLS